MSDVIVAPATAPGRAALAVVRLSGAGAGDILQSLCGPLPPARRASVRVLRHQSAKLDQALVLWMPGPGSYSGEDMVELHLHGGPGVVGAVLDAAVALGARMAEPGEFTRRAFANGKLDLAQAEAVADLVEAQTAIQARQALEQLGGALSRRHDGWRERMIDILAYLEAAIDFPDEELPVDVARRARPLLEALLKELDAALEDAKRGRRVREGLKVALIGAPNAGKSSLLNALVGRSAAIVANTPGTTRDVIEQSLTLSGHQLLLADTAGMRVSEEEIEAEGVRRARAWAEEADLRILVVDGSADDGAWVEARLEARRGDLCVINKADRHEGPDAQSADAWAGIAGLDVCRISLTLTGEAPVRTWLEKTVVDLLDGSDFPAATRIRHAERLADARRRLDSALKAADQGAELAAEDVRLAARALERVTGKVGAEEVLGRVFSSFCIGK
jgi:tRNA modification GTPase